GNQDSPYVIFEDSQPWQRVQEVKSNAQARTLSIDFDKGTGVIEIAGSKVLPEFGTVSAVVFAIAIIGIIMISTKYKHFKFLPNP
ncbi:MAG TPA: PEFG-CTERM sorting domain-containing protein, partial [Nitrososphaeraceae archaeon]